MRVGRGHLPPEHWRCWRPQPADPFDLQAAWFPGVRYCVMSPSRSFKPRRCDSKEFEGSFSLEEKVDRVLAIYRDRRWSSGL
jgi:hypothetical protein